MKILTRRKKQEVETVPVLERPEVSRIGEYRGFTAITGQSGSGRTTMAFHYAHFFLAEEIPVTVIDVARQGVEYRPLYRGLTIAARPIAIINALNRAHWHAQKMARLSPEEAAKHTRPVLVVESYEALVALIPVAEHLIQLLTGPDARFVDVIVCLSRVTPRHGRPQRQFEPLDPGYAPTLASVKRRWPSHAETVHALIHEAAEETNNWQIEHHPGSPGPVLRHT